MNDKDELKPEPFIPNDRLIELQKEVYRLSKKIRTIEQSKLEQENARLLEVVEMQNNALELSTVNYCSGCSESAHKTFGSCVCKKAICAGKEVLGK